MNAQLDRIRQSFLRESTYLRVSSPLFSFLARCSADDDDILDLCSATRRGQSPGVLLMFVAHYLLLKSPEPKLARYFASLVDEPDPVGDAFPAFREFCMDRRPELMELLSWRTVNTNLVEKASFLLPAIQHVKRLSEEPLTLLEICCSAGLNLLFDEYHYDYGAAGRVGAEDSPVRLDCKIIGSGRPPVDAIPRVAHRVGVDLVKMDTSDRLEQLWMEAVLCPEWRAERKRLRAALAIRNARELQILTGDALELLPSLLEELPGSLCILQSYCMGHWSAAAKIELEELLLSTSRRRDIHRLAIDMPERDLPAAARRRLANLAAAGIPILQKSAPSQIEHTWYANAEANTRLLGEGDIFGVWIDWQAGASGRLMQRAG